MEKMEAIVLLAPQASNFLTSGNRINDINREKANGISTVLAKMRIVNRAKTVSMA